MESLDTKCKQFILKWYERYISYIGLDNLSPSDRIKCNVFMHMSFLIMVDFNCILSKIVGCLRGQPMWSR